MISPKSLANLKPFALGNKLAGGGAGRKRRSADPDAIADDRAAKVAGYLAAIEAIANDEAAPVSVRIDARTYLIDRAIGRPVVVTGEILVLVERPATGRSVCR